MKRRTLLAGSMLFLLGAILAGGLCWRYEPTVSDVPKTPDEPREQAASEVPRTLDEAHEQMLRILPAAEIERIRAMPSEEEMIDYHFGFGRWMRNNWGLWSGGELATSLRELGLRHPDDMSGVILDTFWCRLHNQPFRLEQRIAQYDEYWRSMEMPTGGSPKDGGKIEWVSIQGEGKGAIHLGISRSDGSYWRYEYGSGRGIEAAKPDECEALKEVQETWKIQGKPFPNDAGE